jgi:hypothetical protein
VAAAATSTTPQQQTLQQQQLSQQQQLAQQQLLALLSQNPGIMSLLSNPLILSALVPDANSLQQQASSLLNHAQQLPTSVNPVVLGQQTIPTVSEGGSAMKMEQQNAFMSV